MRTWTATTTTAARPEDVLEVREASGRGLMLAADGPVGFDVDYRLSPAGRRVGFPATGGRNTQSRRRNSR